MKSTKVVCGKTQKVSSRSYYAGVFVSVSALALAGSAFFAETAIAQDVSEDEVIVTGIRSSLKQSMDFKRDADGVVDAINAEDIGKFPSTNLAESLQRIPGVSIDRVNGEGSQITVRGFGPDFNQVTLNGRSMPTADIPLIGGDATNTNGSGRAFDFSNIASEGVKALEVFKTGRANIASGGIGATVDVVTHRPLDKAGLTAVLGAKALLETSDDSITPDINGLVSWSNDAGNIGISANASYSKREGSAPSATSFNWQILPADGLGGRVTGGTTVNNLPSSGLVAVPFDSRIHFSEFERERLNGQVVLQFAPSDKLELTADYTFAKSEGREERGDVSNWFSTPFSEITFDSSSVPTSVFIEEVNAGGNKDYALQQTTRGLDDKLDSFGLNVAYKVRDNIELVFDGHTSKAEVTPNLREGFSELNVGMAWPTLTGHSVDFSGDAPFVEFTSSDTDGLQTFDVGTSIANDLRNQSQYNDIDQYDLHLNWDLGDNSHVVFGGNLRNQSNETDNTRYRQVLGNWGVENPGDIEDIAPGILRPFDQGAQFNSLNVGNLPAVRGSAEALYFALSDAYAAGYNGAAPRERFILNSSNDIVEEDVLALYAQFSSDFNVGDMPANINVGLRYEETDVTSKSASVPTGRIDWTGNDDFATFASDTATGFELSSSYDNWLPNVDLGIEISDDLKLRTSYSKTIARPTYNNLFVTSSVGQPTIPTALGGTATGSIGNPALEPLESDNFDVSLEFYYDDDSYVSVGAFQKQVRNFVGIETVDGNLFGIRDVTSGAAGTRSGNALGILDAIGANQSVDNFFAAAAYLELNGGDVASAQAAYLANSDANGNIDPTELVNLETNVDIQADGTDPLMNFRINQPVNNETASIHGIEIQGQHFFGDSGFGIAGSYTLVDGDVSYDVTADPADTQFALAGLSDTANVTLIYERNALSARLAYNWRDEFLLSANRGFGFNSPINVEAYGQLDFSANYDVNERLAISLEGINLTEEVSRWYGRSESQLLFVRENAARYMAGARYKF